MLLLAQTSVAFLSPSVSKRLFLEWNLFLEVICLNHYSLYQSSRYLSKFYEALKRMCKVFLFCSGDDCKTSDLKTDTCVCVYM